MISLQTLTDLSSTGDMTELFGPIMALFAGLIVVALIIGAIIYIYLALTLMIVGKKTNTPNSWLAWIPIANFYLKAKIAQKSAWPLWLLLTWILYVIAIFVQSAGFLIAVMFLAGIASLIVYIFTIVWDWKICQVRGRPGWWAILAPIASLLAIIPILGMIISLAGGVWMFVMWGILAWSDKTAQTQMQTKPAMKKPAMR